MKVSISQITTYPKDMETDAMTFSRAGLKNVELTFDKVYAYLKQHTLDEMRELFDKSGLRAVSAIGLAPETAGLLLASGETWSKYQNKLEEQIQISSKMGCGLIGVGADPKGYVYDNWERQAVDNLRRAGDIAAKYNMKLGLEFMYLPEPVGPFVLDHLRETVELVLRADHPNIGYFLDLFHMHNGGDGLEILEDIDMRKLLNVHFCDAANKPAGTLFDGDRLLPGKGCLPLDDIVALLKRRGYNGYLCLELLNEELWNMEAQPAADLCRAAMVRYENI